jgi:hypothetical protein
MKSMGVCPVCKQWERLMWDGVVEDHPSREPSVDRFHCDGGRFAPLETMPLDDSGVSQ